jgi:hypothetical protein
MNKLKLGITFSLLLVSTLGSTQVFAKNINVRIGKIAEGKEIILPSYGETVEHAYQCDEYQQAVYIRTNGSKIQPACADHGRLDSTVTPIDEGITFISDKVKYKDAVLDVDTNKIR